MLAKWKAQLGTQILEKMARSDEAGEHLNAIPLSIVSMSIKAALNFLIMYRLATGYTIPDVALSMLITCFTTLLSPGFYRFARQYEPELLDFTNRVRNQVLGPGGLDYALTWRNRGVVAASAGTIVLLKTVPVDSDYLIRCIVEWLLSFWIADQITQYRDGLYLPRQVDWYHEFLPPVNKCTLEYVKIPLHHIKRVSPQKRLIEEYNPPQRARQVNIKPNSKLQSGNMTKSETKPVKLARTSRHVFEDWTCI